MSHPSNTPALTLDGLIGQSAIRKLFLVVFGVFALAALSQVSIGKPVPMTLQTLGVMLIGLTYGWRLAAVTVGAYVLAGIAGAPVFADFKSGWSVFAGGTGGYLVGFFFAAAVIGWFADKGLTKSWPGTIIALLVGEVIIFSLGIAWLTSLFTFQDALNWGLYPFVLGDLIKVALAALIGKGVIAGVRRFARL